MTFLSHNRLRTRKGKILHFGSAKKRRNWERHARMFRHGKKRH